jgi:hypothetical protein
VEKYYSKDNEIKTRRLFLNLSLLISYLSLVYDFILNEIFNIYIEINNCTQDTLNCTLQIKIYIINFINTMQIVRIQFTIFALYDIL